MRRKVTQKRDDVAQYNKRTRRTLSRCVALFDIYVCGCCKATASHGSLDWSDVLSLTFCDFYIIAN